MNKRTFIQSIGLLGVTFWFKSGAQAANGNVESMGRPMSLDEVLKESAEFTLPKLSFDYNALEPNIDKMTMEIHHSRHHQAYINNLNTAIKDTPAAALSLEQLLETANPKMPVVRNNAGGHYNHTLFWTLMSPKGGGEPQGALATAIKAKFNTIDTFKDTFTKEAMGRFGSGWAWLCVDKSKQLFISSTPNQDNPLMLKLNKKSGSPVLALDVWEHAYYLKYQNKRADYIKAFWNVVNWEEAGKLYEKAMG